MLRNPFEFGRELSPEELVDRDAEVAAVVASMTSGGKLFLIGPRRYGKTSILRAAADQATHRGAVVLRYDAEAFPGLEEMASRLLADTASRLTGTVEKAGAAIKEFFASVRPQTSFDPVHGKWSVTLAPTGTRTSGAPLLADVLDGVERAAERSEQPVSVVIDEFQKIIEHGGEDAEGQIRAAVQRHRHVGYVFAGSKTRMLAEMTGDPSRPFYRLGEIWYLGPVPREDFAPFLEKGFRGADIQVADGAVTSILDAAEDVPYNVQALAHACWEACREGSAPWPLTSELVMETRDRVALRNDPLYTQLWSSLAASQQKALTALLREKGEGLTSTDVSVKYRLPVSTMQKALRSLESKGIVREEQARGTVRLRLEDPFFGAWIELVVPS